MALSNVLVLSQITGHVIAFILSLCIFVPLSLHLQNFKYIINKSFNHKSTIIFYFFLSGHCLLFTTGNWREDNGLFDAQWANQVFCSFPIATGVLLFLISSVEIYR